MTTIFDVNKSYLEAEKKGFGCDASVLYTQVAARDILMDIMIKHPATANGIVTSIKNSDGNVDGISIDGDTLHLELWQAGEPLDAYIDLNDGNYVLKAFEADEY